MQSLFLRLRKRWYERALARPFNRKASLKLDSIQQKIDMVGVVRQPRKKLIPDPD